MKGIVSKVVTLLLAIVVAILCIFSLFSLLYIAATIIGIYDEGPNRFNLGYLAGQILTLIVSVVMVYVLGKQFKKLEWS
ncbi:hypothetical protein FCH33_06345 [Serratia fonticola]|jgi:uncharacterized BrkB/YihY/UPF0761 family membrane protein|uniref:hypothetical protein n=1 Tax=Serratia fonticola TaxID=47917 RepID=UPI001575868F|nr:hypothetical protein [Serratia fonticola]NTY86388.1 hypothetical protein [Serratia fonticola]NTZ12273.1 hypothetical protein [Serratia fonticola]